jgi:hypothetical protein
MGRSTAKAVCNSSCMFLGRLHIPVIQAIISNFLLANVHTVRLIMLAWVLVYEETGISGVC